MIDGKEDPDSLPYFVRVTVLNSPSGGLEAAMAVYPDEAMTGDKTEIVFPNAHYYIEDETEETWEEYEESYTEYEEWEEDGTEEGTGEKIETENGRTGKAEEVKTGDGTPVELWAAVLCVSGCLSCILWEGKGKNVK